MSSEWERKRRAFELFKQVVEVHGPARSRLLDEACADDADLRARVEALLQADATETEPFAGNAQAWRGLMADDAGQSGDEAVAGRLIGAWRIAGVLGRGGMGAVYRVERSDGAYAQHAALKLIRSGSDSPSTRERFLRERQTLARLQHPHIATLLDGGVSNEGDPYFVMELVEGVPIDRWCDQRRLGLQSRVELFLQVLEAVRYAHRNLIVHRDLKPSNLLVDEQGRVKLLDFGIAKQLEGGDVTALNDRALTFEYASPEQLHDAPITTATDIWQLGIVLHRLLSGAHPFGLTQETPLAKQLQMLEREPEPLTRAAAQATQEQAALRSGHTPASLSKSLRGELSQIVQGCLRRQPESRYSSAEALADDLRRWRDHRPLRIAPPGRGERLRLWLRRNRVLATASAAVAIALLAGAGVALWQAREARAQARIAERESANARAALGFLSDTLAATSPEHAMDTEVSVRRLLDHARAQLDKRGVVEPEVRQPVQRMLGHLYYSLGEGDIAVDLYAAGLKGVAPTDRGDALTIADDLAGYTDALGSLERGPEALAAASQVATLRARFAPNDQELHLRTLNTVAAALYGANQLEPAAQKWRQVLKVAQRLPQPPSDATINAYQMLSSLAAFDGQVAESLAMADQGLAFADRHGVPAQSPLRVVLLRAKAVALKDGGQPAEAEPVIRQAIAVQEGSVGKTGLWLASLYNDLGLILSDRGRYRQAVQVLAHSDQLEEASGLGPENIAINQANLGVVWESAGDYEKGVALLHDALETLGKGGIAGDQPRYRMTERSYANLLGLAGRVGDAHARLTRLREQARVLDGEDSFEYAITTWYLTLLAQRMGNAEEGLPLLEESAERWPQLVPEHHVVYATSHRLRARFARMQGDLALAEREQRQALERQRNDQANPMSVAFARAELAAILFERGDKVQARKLLEQALPPMRASLEPGHVYRAEAEALATRF